MDRKTNRLVAAASKSLKSAKPAVYVSALALGAIVFMSRGAVHPASASVSPLDDSSVTALTQLDQAMESVAARVTPAVVNIAVTSRASEHATAEEGGQQGPQGMQGLPPGLQQFFGSPEAQQPQQPQIEHGIGSGVIISPDGYIVTNNHVVEGATQIRVTLNDRRVFTGRVVGVDKLTDLAVVKINATDLPSIAWGDSTQLKPGETVLAFGSPFGYFQFSVTRGIVSAVNRPNPYNDNARKPGGFIQTDAAINPGNSGGPLVNAHGQLVGINTFIISDSGSFAGAGFAIPAQIVHATAEQLIKTGKVEHGYLGISMNDVTPDNAAFFNLKDASGAIVAQVSPDSPASRGGLQQGDVITELNGQKVINGGGLQVAVSEMTPGTGLTLGVLRQGRPVSLHLTLGQFHNDQQVADNEGDGSPSQGKLGLAVSNLTPDARAQLQLPANVQGVVIQSVRPESPGDDAGLQPGDVIQEVDRVPASSANQFVSEVHKNPAGKDLLLLVWSKGNASYRTLHTDGGQQNG